MQPGQMHIISLRQSARVQEEASTQVSFILLKSLTEQHKCAVRDQKKVCTIISKRLVMQAKSPVRSYRDSDAMSARMLSPISKRRGSIEESKSKKKSPPKVSFITAGNANNDGGSVMNESVDYREGSPDMGGVSQLDIQESHGD